MTVAFESQVLSIHKEPETNERNRDVRNLPRKLVKTVVPLKVGKVFEFPCNRFLDWSVAGRQVATRLS